MPELIRPGLLVLHGNRLEMLKDAVFGWLGQHPLGVLEEEIFLVQSNGVAEWLKMELARSRGICAATRVELPARFLWRSYRQVLGARAVPSQSPLDKSALTWRLMRLLPTLVKQPGFEPLAGFLDPVADTGRRLQLAQRLADLYDQYQVYRADWLGGWASGSNAIAQLHGGRPEPLADNQRWQAALWRATLEELTPDERATARPRLHQRFLDTLESGEAPQAPQSPQSPIARRVVLFGMSHVPLQTLEALAALATRSQVLLAIPNPCRYHWADIIEGRELMRFERQRQASKGMDLSTVSLESLHAHANPLLAAWGRQGRDFVRQLDAFDDRRASEEKFAIAKIDLFDEGRGETLLAEVQANIRDMVPLIEHTSKMEAASVNSQRPGHTAPDDRSIVFHIAHSAQREVEILHDRLLALFARPGNQLEPRQIVVMVPNIDTFAPSIRAVFGQHAHNDRRRIPFDISDLQQRGANPVVIAIEWLLRLPQQRCRLSEIRDLLDVPAIAARFGIEADDLPTLTRWMDGAGVRWGLHLDQRSDLGLDACGDQNTWLFGLQRMLLGYASGGEAAFQDIEPYDEVGGLDASIAGSLASLVQALAGWWRLARLPCTPERWAEHGRALVTNFLKPGDERERLTAAALQDGLRHWLDDCALAGFDEEVPLAVMREAWLGNLDEPGLGKRFLAGGVTFCTLLPMRAVPFEVVCLLGMNDGDYPRSTSRSDFDLMGWPGQRRPGDRSRRDDDRYLMLEAVLAARQMLYVSWSGRSARDNAEQPPSVLVSQLRDYLSAGWGDDVVTARTTSHPLQPFSRQYFSDANLNADVDADGADGADGAELYTYAREWRAAHAVQLRGSDAASAHAAGAQAAASASAPSTHEMPAFDPASVSSLTVRDLARFLGAPVRTFFVDRLDVRFDNEEPMPDDDEAFAIGGLGEYTLLEELLSDLPPAPGNAAAALEARAARIQRSGRLPMGRQGTHARRQLVATATPMLAAFNELRALYPVRSARQPLRFSGDGDIEGISVDDWLENVRVRADTSEAASVHISLLASHLTDAKKNAKNDSARNAKPGAARPERLLEPWVRMLVTSACGVALQSVIVGRDAVLTLQPYPAERATELLRQLLSVWRDGMIRPLPLARDTGIAFVSGADEDKLVETYEGAHMQFSELERDPSLARAFPDFAALNENGDFKELATLLYAPLAEWVGTNVHVRPHDTSAMAAVESQATGPAGTPEGTKNAGPVASRPGRGASRG